MCLVDLKEVSKHYLDINFNLQVNKGDLIVISGTNGTGKSTLIKLIVGFIKPDRGLLIKHTKNISYLSEHQSLPEGLYIENYLKAIERIRKGMYNKVLFEKFDIPYNKKISQLSKGNKQKLLIVSNIVGNNDLYVFDEPLSGLDDNSVLVFKSLIKGLKDAEKSVIISTHNPNVFNSIANKRVIL